jgi:DNA-binding CsgD family transcriptional regulator/tetratricopeptide (TPR) repeat protein
MILEREVELAKLAQLLDGAASSGGRVVLVRGEAGIGKSALINRFLRDREDRAHTMLGGCDDLLTPQPLAPIWDIARSTPSLVQPLADGDRRAIMEMLLGLLSRELRPTVLVLEDTQWADEATLDLITFIGRRIGRANGLLLLTYRDIEVDTEHPLRQVIGELPQQNVSRMSLDRLSPDAVSSMIGSAAFDIDEVVELTGGNPLFVAEVLASGTGQVPLSVSEAVLARAAKLSPVARQVLDAVSVAPGQAERWLVAQLVGASDEQLAECERHGLLVVGDDVLSFPHDLQRRAVESSLALSERRRLNQRVLDALRGSADPARLVHHATEAGDIDAIVEYAPRAARAAMAARSTSEAVAQFRRLQPHLDRIEIAERAAVLTDWAAQEYQLDRPEAVVLFEEAIELHRAAGDPNRLALVLTMASRANWANGHAEAALAYSDEAVTILEPNGLGPDLARALSQRAHLEFDYEDRDEAVLPLVDRAIAVAREVGDAEALVRALSDKGYLLYSRGHVTGMALMEESLEVAERSGDQWGEVIALTNMAGMFGDVRDVSRATDFAQRARDTAARYDIRSLMVNGQAMYAEFLLWKGDWEAAENTASDAIESSPFVEALARRVLGTIQARRGRNEARTAIMRMWSLTDTESGPSVLDPAAATLAEYLWLSGEHNPELVDRLEQVLASMLVLGRPWPSGSFAFWMWKLGLLDLVPDGSEDSYRWILTGDYRRAAQFWHEKEIPYEEGLALMHGNEAEQVQAIRIFEDLGATAIANNVRRSLAQHGARVPRGKSLATRDHPAGLTARQAEVLRLLARGMPNTRIADELFVSHRTVENHVSAILMKLDVATREAAVTTARGRGILPAG